MKGLLYGAAVLTLGLSSACASATPTFDPAQIQASAVAAAGTMVAQTQAAMPTPTDIPPTDTPSPTPLPLPTLPLVPTVDLSVPTIAPTGSADNCNHVMDLNSMPKARAKLLINNHAQGPANLSLGYSTINAFGQCGYLVIPPIARNSSITISVPYATGPCYYANAWINDPKKQRYVGGGPFCMNNPDKWTMDITYDRITLTPP